MPRVSLISVNTKVTQVQAHRVAQLGSDKMSVRLMTAAFVAIIFGQLAEPATYILFIEDSLTYRVARIIPWGGNTLVGVMFYVCALACLPHLFALIFKPERLRRKGPRKLMTTAGCCGALLWFMMAMTASPLDYDYLSWVFVFRGSVDLLAGVLFAVSLNAQRAAELWSHFTGIIHHVDLPTH